ncbi:MAG: hypothetical protein R3174_12965 [Gammaproteobacteria bacterium]|nr:hypothetical protein [Gammaproteobacteria bacterium]
MMSDPSKKDAELGEYLKGDSGLSRAYRDGSGELPPAHVDARILAEARAAGAPRRPAPGPFSNRWMAPVSLAVMVLAISVVALLPEPDPSLPEVTDVVGKPDAGPARESVLRDEKASVSDDQGRKARSEEADPDPGRRKLEKRVDLPGAGEPKSYQRLMPPASSEGYTRPPATAPPDSGAAGMPEQEPSGALSDQEIRLQRLPETPAERLRSPRQRALPSEAKPSEGAVTGYARPPPAAMESESPAVAAEAREQNVAGREPDAWLEKISQLIKEGRVEAAARELELFRQAYPRAEVPPEIRNALEATGH